MHLITIKMDASCEGQRSSNDHTKTPIRTQLDIDFDSYQITENEPEIFAYCVQPSQNMILFSKSSNFGNKAYFKRSLKRQPLCSATNPARQHLPTRFPS